MDRKVTERDLRAPEFMAGEPDEYEFREDGKIVRKDRWETGVRNIACALGWQRKSWEIQEVVNSVKQLCAANNWRVIDEDDLPPAGQWLVSVNTDNGPVVHTLDLNTKGEWIHDGEPTFCHGYFFQPTHYKPVPQPAKVEEAESSII